jgi:hypothetical protein
MVSAPAVRLPGVDSSVDVASKTTTFHRYVHRRCSGNHLREPPCKLSQAP